MIIKIANLSDGIHRFSFDEKVEDIKLEEPFIGNFIADVEVMKSHNQIILNVELHLNARFECDRCTVLFDTTLDTEYQIVYFFGIEPVESEAVNIIYLHADADKIDISPELREYALFSVPMKKLCKDECRGLCYKCGIDLNENECNCTDEIIDDRWLPLLELKKKLNNN